MVSIHYPTSTISIPSKDDIDNFLKLPTIQMYCTSRSGTAALHALLDAHPEIIQICEVFKYYDFLYTLDDDDDNFEVVGRKFIESHLNAHIFNSCNSNTTKNRLGKNGNINIHLNKSVFLKTLLTISEHHNFNYKNFFYFVHLSYLLCFNEPLKKKLIFQHLHHGDWIYSQFLIDKGKLFGSDQLDKVKKIANSITAETQIVMIRNPYKSLLSVQQFCDRFIKKEPDIIIEKERQLTLLAQEYLRNMLIKGINNSSKYFLKLENLKENPLGEMENICHFLGIRKNLPISKKLTFYGQNWLGDASMAPKIGLRKEPSGFPSEEDCIYLNLLCLDAISLFGYQPVHFELDKLRNYRRAIEKKSNEGNSIAKVRLATLKQFQYFLDERNILTAHKLHLKNNRG